MRPLGFLILFLILFFQSLYAAEERKQEAAISLKEMNEVKALVWLAATQSDNRK